MKYFFTLPSTTEKPHSNRIKDHQSLKGNLLLIDYLFDFYTQIVSADFLPLLNVHLLKYYII